MNWVVNESAAITVERMLMQLAGVCNYAATLDGQGFSAFDAGFGHSLAERAQRGIPYTEKQAQSALKMIRKYQGQLGGKSFMDEFLQHPVFTFEPVGINKQPENPFADRVIDLDGDRFSIRFKYNRELVEKVKSSFQGVHGNRKFWASWNGSYWSVPINAVSVVLLEKFAQAQTFTVSADLTNHLAKMLEPVKEDVMLLCLNDGLNATLAGDMLSIAIDDPVLMKKFVELGALNGI